MPKRAKPTLKPLAWVGSSREDLREFPDEVRVFMGHAMYLAQCGEKAVQAKPLKGFGGAGVVEVVKAFGGEAFRAVYTVNFADRVYVLHAFQKKSKRGIATSREDNEMVRQRLMRAREMHADWLQQHGGDDG